MKCLICRRDIEKREQVFLGTTVTYNGPEEYDFSHVQSENNLEGVVHLLCLKSSVPATTTLNTVPCELVVERSNALDLLGI